MSVKYVIGTLPLYLPEEYCSSVFIVEHMEDDEETSKAIPEWVELEYCVRDSKISMLEYSSEIIYILAYAHASWAKL